MDTNAQENVTPITRRRGGRRAAAATTPELQVNTPADTAVAVGTVAVVPDPAKEIKTYQKKIVSLSAELHELIGINEKLTKENESMRLSLQQQRNYYSAVLANVSNSIMNIRDQLTLADVNGR
jgi:nitrogen fixation/metabolism regulation signal transduction histidine kinase